MALAGNIGVELNLLCRRGHILGPFEIDWTDDVDAPIPITGGIFDSVIYITPPTGVAPVPLLDNPFTITVVSGPQGMFRFVLPTAISDGLPLAILNYAISITLAGERTPLFFGKLEVRFG
jgi:hypothetical protein